MPHIRRYAIIVLLWNAAFRYGLSFGPLPGPE